MKLSAYLKNIFESSEKNISEDNNENIDEKNKKDDIKVDANLKSDATLIEEIVSILSIGASVPVEEKKEEDIEKIKEFKDKNIEEAKANLLKLESMTDDQWRDLYSKELSEQKDKK